MDDDTLIEASLMDIETDKDFALALQLQYDQLEEENRNVDAGSPVKCPQSIVDATWEQMDPSPDIHGLFLEFNAQYFWGKLDGIEVRWSPRMTLCAGLCCYEGRSGLCSVRLSEPLLKLRPRKDLVQTLLHEMIHAFLFVTHNNKDHDDHGPEFCKHMQRINRETGANVTVYHSFHDEVDFYRKHWWKCDGPCQKWRPYFGTVRRAMNRPPSPRDPWWAQHQERCGGVFKKIKEPEDYKAPKKRKSSEQSPVDEKRLKTAQGIVPFSGKGHTLGASSASNSGSTSRIPLKPVSQSSPFKNKPSVSSLSSKSTSNLKQIDLTNYFTPKGDAKKSISGELKNKAITKTDHSSSSTEHASSICASVREKSSVLTIGGMKRNHAHRRRSSAEKAKDFLQDLFSDFFDDDRDDDCCIIDNSKDVKDGTVEPSCSSEDSNETACSDSHTSLFLPGHSNDEDSDTCSCPVCNATVTASYINEHLDRCLQQSSS